MSKKGIRRFLVDALYESFCRCGSNIRKVNDDSWKYSTTRKRMFNRLFPANLKQQPDLIYRMTGDPKDTWFYVFPTKDDMGQIDMDFVA